MQNSLRSRTQGAEVFVFVCLDFPCPWSNGGFETEF